MAPVSSTPSDRRGAAEELLRLLYPPPLSVAAGWQRRSPVAAWLAVPSTRSPRLLVAGRSSAAATAILRRQLTGQRLRTRAARAALSVAVQSGIPLRLPQLTISVTGDPGSPSIHDPLCDALGVSEVDVSLPIGPARANRKPVLQVTDSHGHVLAFAKVGHHALTRGLVDHEAQALAELASTPHGHIRPPLALAHVTWRDLSLLLLEPLDIPANRLSGAAARRRMVEVTLDIAGPLDDSRPWSAHPHRTALLSGLSECGSHRERVRHQLELLSDQTVVSVTDWHGDLNSGNLALVPGPCPVWDWERFGTGVPLGFDLLHHDLHEMITVGQRPPGQAADMLLSTSMTILEPLGVSREASDLAARSYLLTLAQRYLADRQADAGADLGKVETWLLPALEKHSERDVAS